MDAQNARGGSQTITHVHATPLNLLLHLGYEHGSPHTSSQVLGTAHLASALLQDTHSVLNDILEARQLP
eukprot:scaffold218274_cov15-Tisochrysis_lutea.AAC.1